MGESRNAGRSRDRRRGQSRVQDQRYSREEQSSRSMREKRRRRQRREMQRRFFIVCGLLVVLCAAGCWTLITRSGRQEETAVPKIKDGAIPKLSQAGEAAIPQEPEETGNGPEGEGAGEEKPVWEKKVPPEGFELTLASEDWGLSYGDSGTQPRGNAAPEDLAWYNAYYVGAAEEKVLYLTFDCGYENGNTEPILDALKKHNAKGTFFVVGHFLETAPEMVKRMAEEGHAVGNHTYHHPDMSAISDLESFGKELSDVAELFREITGKELSPYYRPPQGKCNVENLKMAQELGYDTIFWSLAHVDWNQDKQPSHEESFDKLTKRVHPGAIVLLHNTSKTNGEILDELLTRWEEMGYRFAPLSDLVGR